MNEESVRDCRANSRWLDVLYDFLQRYVMAVHIHWYINQQHYRTLNYSWAILKAQIQLCIGMFAVLYNRVCLARSPHTHFH